MEKRSEEGVRMGREREQTVHGSERKSERNQDLENEDKEMEGNGGRDERGEDEMRRESKRMEGNEVRTLSGGDGGGVKMSDGGGGVRGRSEGVRDRSSDAFAVHLGKERERASLATVSEWSERGGG